MRNSRTERGRSQKIQWTWLATAIPLRDVFTIPTTLPEDPALLQQMLRAALAEIGKRRPEATLRLEGAA